MSQQWTPPEQSGNDDVQMPLGVGGDSEAPAEETYADSKPKVNSSTIALVAAFAAALAVLYLLGLQNKPRAASAEQQGRQAQVAAAIDEMIHNNGSSQKIASLIGDTKHLVNILMSYLNSKPQQLKDIPNPFEQPVVRSDPGPIVTVPIVDNHQAELLRNTAEEIKSLKLQMIMFGRSPTAMINNRVVEPGAKFKYVTVKEITPDSVLLTNELGTWPLSLSADQH